MEFQAARAIVPAVEVQLGLTMLILIVAALAVR
jgi:hypothetical protein